MRLTNRLMVILIPVVTAGLVGVFSITSVFVLTNFERVETEGEMAELRRMETTILEDLERLDSTNLDWSHWDETYAYLQGTNPEYPETNFAPISYASNRLHFVVILDLAGDIVNGTGFDPETSTFLPLPQELATSGGRAALGLPDPVSDDAHVTGVVTVGGEPHMVSAWAVLTNEEEGPFKGGMIWGSRITGPYAQELADRRNQDFHLMAWHDADERAQALDPGEADVASSLLQDETMTGRLRMDDLTGQPALLIHHEAPRDIYQHGLSAMTYSFAAAAAVALGFLAIGVLLIRQNVTGPVAHLSGRIQEIRDGSANHVLARSGNDEVSSMANAFHGLLGELDDRERRLREQNRELDGFAAVVSHDLLSPLSTVNLNARMLQDDIAAGDQASANEHLGRIRTTSTAIEERVRALLSYARAGRDMGVPEPVDLAALAMSVLAEMAAELQSAGARIDVGTLPTVMGNAPLLKQVLQNLVSNAAKYHKPGRPATIRIDARQEGAMSRITISDDGIGFDEADVAEMLTPFRRLERTKGIQGHGIGLASCARIMERMGGRLELHGTVGVGGQATLVLPTAAQAADRGGGPPTPTLTS